jgi:hypothetical protein
MIRDRVRYQMTSPALFTGYCIDPMYLSRSEDPEQRLKAKLPKAVPDGVLCV